MSNSDNLLLLSNHELDLFNSAYLDIVDKLVARNDENMEDMAMVTDYMLHVIDYNVPKGKKLRGLMVLAMYKSLLKSPTDEDLHLAAVVGWCLEITQGACLVADDIMDHSETRRGQPCWYTIPEVGMSAINDSFMLEHVAYQVLRMYIGEKPYFSALMNHIKDTMFKTIFGQSLDCQTEKVGNFTERFTMDRYSAIVKYKTSYYTTYTPILLALVLAEKGKEYQDVLPIVKDLMLDIGHYFQVQDDFLDCFGDEDVTGKVGTDIQDNKCTWLVVTAIPMCNEGQLVSLKENYGRQDSSSVTKVKGLYRDLDMVAAYNEYEDESYARISHKITELPKEIPQDIFFTILSYLYHRTK